jgi:hypothetical protein
MMEETNKIVNYFILTSPSTHWDVVLKLKSAVLTENRFDKSHSSCLQKAEFGKK